MAVRESFSNMNKLQAVFFSATLSAVFTFASLYFALELPNALNRLLIDIFPDYGFGWEKAEEFVNSVRPLGYVCLGITLALIIFGAVLGSGKLAFVGSLTLYLPAFSYFATAMFFLAGVGILRVLWLPIIELMPGSSIYEKIYMTSNIIELGDIVYLPYDAIRFVLLAFIREPTYHGSLDEVLFKVIVIAGSILFFISCATWFYTKFQKLNFASILIYKHSRHPQYVSFLIWSYGLLVYDKYVFNPPKGGYFAPPPLLWLLFALTVIGTALHEEKTMLSKHSKEYTEYRSRTPFMIPIGKPFGRILTAPVRLVFKKTYPEKAGEITAILAAYCLVLILASIPYVIPSA